MSNSELPAPRRREPFLSLRGVLLHPPLLIAGLLTAAYLFLHIWSLPWFPFVHSDEAWLASLSRTMVLEGRLDATEEFFRLTPRHPHALKTVFHLIQAPFLLLRWSAVAARLPSLVAGLGAVVLLGVTVKRLTENRLAACAVGCAFALDVQFFYTSHLGRQEALVLLAMMGGLFALLRPGRSRRLPPALTAGVIIGLTIFVHPNAFIAALALLPWAVVADSTPDIGSPPDGRSGGGGSPGSSRLQRSGVNLALYVAVLAGFGALAVAASYAMDPRFLAHYLEFGGSVGVTAGPVERVAHLREFFIKMAGRHAGTYYLPPVAPQLWALMLLLLLSLLVGPARLISTVRRGPNPRSVAASRSRAPRQFSACPGALGAVSTLLTVLALFLIGKFSPPSVVFLIPWLYLQAGVLLHRLGRRGGFPLASALLLLMPVATGAQLLSELPNSYPGSYDRYLSEIREFVPEGEVALANLNSAFAFEPGELRVYRDLGALPPAEGASDSEEESGLLQRPLGRFLRKEGVAWVVLPREELELIYRNRPVWNAVYGNPHRFYPDLIEILERHGTLVHRFEASRYGMRLVPYMDRGDYHVEIHRLELP
ncbi:MAG: ArnT family glycosyltransferase [Spirochaetaceae bacterium]